MSETLSFHGAEEPLAESRCRNCGGFVTDRFTRVFGDNRNRVFGCFDCMTATEIKNGAANRR